MAPYLDYILYHALKNRLANASSELVGITRELATITITPAEGDALKADLQVLRERVNATVIAAAASVEKGGAS